MFRTSDEQIAEIAEREGFRAKAYRPIPGKNPDGSWKSNLTIAFGQENALFQGTPGEIPITEDLEVTEEMGWQALRHFVYNTTDRLVREHCNPQTQAEHDACASWVYNIRQGKLERNEYSLPKLIARADRSPEALAEINDCWVQYCLTPGAESGLYRRRLVELVDFYGLPKTPAVLGHALSARVARLDKGQPAKNATYFHPSGKFAATVSPEFVLNMAASQKAPVRPRGYTTDELNARERARLAGQPMPDIDLTLPPLPLPKPAKAKPAPMNTAAREPAAVSAQRAASAPPVEAPKVDAAAPPKPMEESKTHKGLSKKESGQETVIIGGTVTGIGALLPNIQSLTNYLQQFPMKTILTAVAVIGVAIILVGLWRWYAGRMIAYEGRQEATTTKV
jgi:GH24 family phage-related lysozyme (muramidase)